MEQSMSCNANQQSNYPDEQPQQPLPYELRSSDFAIDYEFSVANIEEPIQLEPFDKMLKPHLEVIDHEIFPNHIV
jgi:hypothetical protein